MGKRGLGFSVLRGLKEDSFVQGHIEVRRIEVLHVDFLLTACRCFGCDVLCFS